MDVLRIQGRDLFLVKAAAGMITSFSGYTGDNSGTRWLPGDLAAYKDGTAFTSYKGGGV